MGGAADIVLSWPAAVALIAAVIAITGGVLRMFAMGRATMTVQGAHDEIKRLQGRVQELERQVSSMETSIENTIGGQISDLKSDMRHISDKMDTLVREVVNALGALTK